MIVAEYTGRPATAEDFYENVRKLLLYYNARMMCENQNVGIISYFTNKHCDYLLADQPGILQSIVTTLSSKVQRRKGSHVSKEIKLWGLGRLKEELLEEFEPGKPNLERIYSEPLLEELIAYNDQGNFDRVMALVQLMIYKEDLYDTKVKQIKKEEKDKRLFELPIFSEAWFNNSDEVEPDPIFNSSSVPFQIDNDNTIIYTF